MHSQRRPPASFDKPSTVIPDNRKLIIIGIARIINGFAAMFTSATRALTALKRETRKFLWRVDAPRRRRRAHNDLGRKVLSLFEEYATPNQSNETVGFVITRAAAAGDVLARFLVASAAAAETAKGNPGSETRVFFCARRR